MLIMVLSSDIANFFWLLPARGLPGFMGRYRLGLALCNSSGGCPVNGHRWVTLRFVREIVVIHNILDIVISLSVGGTRFTTFAQCSVTYIDIYFILSIHDILTYFRVSGLYFTPVRGGTCSFPCQAAPGGIPPLIFTA